MEEMIIHEEREDINIREELENDLEDEKGDVSKYMELAHWAEMHYPGHGYAAILRDIAKEEAVHHKHIKEILDDMDRHGL